MESNFKYKGPIRFELDLYPNFIVQRTKIKPVNIFEIGANNGDDGEYLRKCFDIDPSNVFCFEANPFTFQILESKYPNFNNFNIAVSNKMGIDNFNCSRSESGSSSLTKKTTIPDSDFINIEINLITMNHFIKHYDIKEIDICKIDVEGFTYEVLEGFEDKLSIIKSIQVENERGLVFTGQNKTFKDTCIYLSEHGFNLLNFVDWGCQCDSLWIRNDMINYSTFGCGCDLVNKNKI